MRSNSGIDLSSKFTKKSVEIKETNKNKIISNNHPSPGIYSDAKHTPVPSPEVIEEIILSYLPFIDLITSCVLVSKGWYVTASQPKLWKKIITQDREAHNRLFNHLVNFIIKGGVSVYLLLV